MKARLLSWAGALLLKAFAATYRFRYENVRCLKDHLGRGGVILPFWHNRLIGACVAPIFRDLDTVVVVSRHKDGEIITGIMRWFRHRAVRGSSGKGGGEALREMEEEVRRGSVVGITPDGPRGPRYVVQPGTAVLCERSRRPVIPFLTFSARRWKFDSWDAFELPQPFSEITLVFGRPIEASGDVETTRARVEEEMKRMVEEGEARYGRRPDFLPAPGSGARRDPA